MQRQRKHSAGTLSTKLVPITTYGISRASYPAGSPVLSKDGRLPWLVLNLPSRATAGPNSLPEVSVSLRARNPRWDSEPGTFWRAYLSIKQPLTAHDPIHPQVSSRHDPSEPGMGMIPDPRQIGDGDGSVPPIPGESGMGVGIMDPRL